MSYAAIRTRNVASAVSVGSRAVSDPLLAAASLDASRILLARAARGIAPSQEAFDSLRLELANRRMDDAIAQLQRGTGGLGQIAPNDRAIGCQVSGAVTTAGGIASIVPVYGTIIGGILGIGGQIAGGALDCTREQREAAQRLAAAQALEAQRQLEAAAALATTSAASRQARIKTVAIGGGVLLALLATTWVVLR